MALIVFDDSAVLTDSFCLTQYDHCKKTVEIIIKAVSFIEKS